MTKCLSNVLGRIPKIIQKCNVVVGTFKNLPSYSKLRRNLLIAYHITMQNQFLSNIFKENIDLADIWKDGRMIDGY